MISRVYISHSIEDEDLAAMLSSAFYRVGLESYHAIYNHSTEIALSERTTYCIRNSDCVVVLLTELGAHSPVVCQETGLARGLDMLMIPLLEEGAEKPFLIEHLRPFVFTRPEFSNVVGRLIRAVRELSRLEWLKIACPGCGEEMTQYLTPQEEVDEALTKGSFLETVCSYCQNRIRLDPRTFEPVV